MNGGIARIIILAPLLLLAACGRSADSPATAASGGQADDRGLVGWWTFDEGSGTTALDASGNGNTATIRNGTWGSGKTGNALQMDGSNHGIVTVLLSDSLRSTADNVTVMGWAYRTAEHNVDLVGHAYPFLFLGFHGPRFKWQIANTRGKKLSCYADPKYRAELNRWFHLAGTYDGRTVRLYVDGEEICSKWSWMSSAIAMPDAPFTISGYLRDTGEIVDEITGKIDEVRIYNRVLSVDEIRRIYQSVNQDTRS